MMITKVTVTGNIAKQNVLVEGQPCVASRPRVTRWGTYYPKKYKDWMAEIHDLLPSQDKKFQEPSHVYVRLVFVVSKAKTSKLTRPHGDIDNFCKAILDALTKRGFWYDDVDITELKATKRYAVEGEEPHTSVQIKRELP